MRRRQSKQNKTRWKREKERKRERERERERERDDRGRGWAVEGGNVCDPAGNNYVAFGDNPRETFPPLPEKRVRLRMQNHGTKEIKA